MENWNAIENFIFKNNEPVAMFNNFDAHDQEITNANERAQLAAAAPALKEACEAARIIFEEMGIPANTSGIILINQALALTNPK